MNLKNIQWTGSKLIKSKVLCRRLLCILMFIIVSCFFVSGCGYAIHKKTALLFDSIQIVNIENRTLEPKLQDKLYTSLTGEFLSEGISVQREAGYKLSGKIKKFELKVLSEKSNVAVEYEVTIKGDFKLVDPEGKVREFKDIGSPFIVSFSGSGLLNELIAYKEKASEKAVNDMASEIVAALIYR